jgi:hypothetical protein
MRDAGPNLHSPLAACEARAVPESDDEELLAGLQRLALSSNQTSGACYAAQSISEPSPTLPTISRARFKPSGNTNIPNGCSL